MRPATVAIAIPAYNAAATIGETLDALQANPALGRVALVALLDDCSADATLETARAHWRSAVPLEIWRNEVNQGERRTVNAAIARLADRVAWTFILHADDVVKPGWLSLYFEAIEEAPDSVASICSSYDNWWPDTGRIEPGDEFPERPPVHVPGERQRVLDTLAQGCWWHISGCGVRNRAFLAIGPFEPDMPQLGDWEWLLRCLAKGYGVWYLPRSTMLYRQSSGSVSSRSFREGRDIKERLQILRAFAAQGYLSRADHRARVRRALAALARRSLVRLWRRDAFGFRAHVSLLARANADYWRG